MKLRPAAAASASASMAPPRVAGIHTRSVAPGRSRGHAPRSHMARSGDQGERAAGCSGFSMTQPT
ncbi:MAG: hypothetical protein R3A52_11030 [Polyangiales bacterium]